jgi:predicted PurR-regulated permease PerM
MATETEEQAQIAHALNNLATAMEKMQIHYDVAQRANRRMRVALFFMTLIILGGGGYWALTPIVTMASALAPRTPTTLDPTALKVEQMRLKDQLSPENRAQIEEFEAQVKWVYEYLGVFKEFDPGAAITLFLGQMSSSVKVMPAMYAEVRAMKQEMQSVNAQMLSMNDKMNALPVLAHEVQGMNGKMNALPVLATEVQGIHRQVGVISTGVDSTMGRAGSMMPWKW